MIHTYENRQYQIDGYWDSENRLISMGWTLQPITSEISKEGISRIESCIQSQPQLVYGKVVLKTVELIPVDEIIGDRAIIGEIPQDRLAVFGYLGAYYENDTEDVYSPGPDVVLSRIGDGINYAFPSHVARRTK